MKKLRVIVCYTGGVGRQVIRLLADHPGIELAGVLVHDERKEGVDAGILSGIEPLGVFATRDLEKLLALSVDCALWHGKSWKSEIVERLLNRGINVYSGIGGWYLHGEPERSALEKACRSGNATLVAGGNIPGLISDVLPLFVSGYAGRVTAIRARQRGYNAHYPSAIQLSQGCGFGIPVDQQKSAAMIDELWLWGMRQSAHMVADGLGLPLDEVKITNKEYAMAPEDMVLEASGLHIPAGTPAGVRWTFTAYSASHPFLQIVNEQTARLELGPDWRQRADEPNWRVDIDGSPRICCEFSAYPGDDGTDHSAALNAARAVNFVPRIVEAAPGCLSILDLPAPRATHFAFPAQTMRR
ncbi:dihydrodipicolinate reductase [Noviherbaspirillum saxi]|uniref:Dihydrodipicolinate reductase n=1 Tax=Noviherbaspirillum saxi TaxID=2320863 RepID=A0A3A3FH13_9BURK|nr:dihydrodipicolinate reductase [Noviherbaspirillum saxi]RJF91688.1 dihydrodipicolinate reductase [Noviherbaspirillum saxi]